MGVSHQVRLAVWQDERLLLHDGSVQVAPAPQHMQFMLMRVNICQHGSLHAFDHSQYGITGRCDRGPVKRMLSWSGACWLPCEMWLRVTGLTCHRTPEGAKSPACPAHTQPLCRPPSPAWDPMHMRLCHAPGTHKIQGNKPTPLLFFILKVEVCILHTPCEGMMSSRPSHSGRLGIVCGAVHS